MDKQSFTRVFLVDQTPQQVFDAITNVPAWWHKEMKGSSKNLNDEFSVQFDDIHYSKHRLTEVVPNKKIDWLTLDSKLTFVEKQSEWTGTTITYEIIEKGKQTELHFRHDGLVPAFQCFEGCSKGWTYFLEESLLPFIRTGKGQPEPKDR